MPFNSSNPVSVGLATRVDHYNRVFDNTLALRAGELALTSQAARDVFFASSATQLARLAPGLTGQMLTTKGASADPVWQYPSGFDGSVAITSAIENAWTHAGILSGRHNSISFNQSGHSTINGISSTGLAIGTTITFRAENSVGHTVTFVNGSPSALDVDRIYVANFVSVSISGRMSVTFVFTGGSVGAWREMVLDTAGLRTHAYLGANQSITSGVETKISLAATVYDTYGEHDTVTTFQWTAREAMEVIVNSGVFFADVSGACYSIIHKNGASVAQSKATIGTAADHVFQIGYQGRLARADTLELRAFHSSGSAKNVLAGAHATYMSIARVR